MTSLIDLMRSNMRLPPRYVVIKDIDPIPKHIDECSANQIRHEHPPGSAQPGTRIYMVNVDGTLKFIDEDVHYE